MSAAIVIGGGIAGLATAALLADEGHEVTLLEARDELGGRAGSWESGGFRWDTGPSWYLMPEVFDHFFRMLGTTAERELDLVPLVPAYRVYTENHPRAPRDRVRAAPRRDALFESDRAGGGRQARRVPGLRRRHVRALRDALPLRLLREHGGAAQSRAC